MGRSPAARAVNLPIDFGSVNNDIVALAVNVTAVNPVSAGYLTTWRGEDPPPLASTLNFTPGETVANYAVVPTTDCDLETWCLGEPMIGIANGSSQPVHVVVDVFGYYDDEYPEVGLSFHPIVPTRIVDTRTSLGSASALAAGTTAEVTPPASIGDARTEALQMNVTVVNHDVATYVSAWPSEVSGLSRPVVSNVNPGYGATVPNSVMTLLGPTGGFNIYNNGGVADIVVDVDGYYDPVPPDETGQRQQVRPAAAPRLGGPLPRHAAVVSAP